MNLVHVWTNVSHISKEPSTLSLCGPRNRIGLDPLQLHVVQDDQGLSVFGFFSFPFYIVIIFTIIRLNQYEDCNLYVLTLKMALDAEKA